MQDKPILLKMHNIVKRFPGTLALDDVELTVRAGQVHVLLGENGAGKSTLVKIIAGVYTRDGGEMWFDGELQDFKGVREAQEAGISIIHQELNLLLERSIAQNIFAGKEPTLPAMPGVIDKKKMVEESRRMMQSIGLDLNPNTLVKNLSIAQQQMVEVVKALSSNMKLLIMDEPTSSLTNKEIDKLFEIIEKLKRDDVAIIYISHRMDEIMRIGDNVSIMRDGRYVDSVDAKTMDMDEVIRKMVGRSLEKVYERNFNTPGDELLHTKNLTGLRFRNVNISVCAGEIVSLSGLVGAGRTELAKALFGYDPILSGEYYVSGQKIKNPTPRKSVRNSIAFLPEDRKIEGVHLQMSIHNNIVMASLQKLFPKGFLNGKKELEQAARYRQELRIASPDVNKLVGELSGGNQQKVVVGKWLSTDCKLFIFDEPTRGIDVGAKAEIYQLLNSLAQKGCGILMISSEMNEVIGLSDRVYVMREGEITKELSHAELSQELILKYAVGGTSYDAS